MTDITAKTRRTRRLMLACTLAAAAALAGCQSMAKHGLTPEQIATLKQRGFVETDDGWTLDQSATVFFSTNDATLAETGARSIDDLAKALKAVGLMHLRVVGYTDSTGTDAYNDSLSKRRADAVAGEFVNDGFPVAGLESVGMGKRHPIADNRTAQGRAQNRHVAIIVVVD
jgi:outer membrane protein OmpA-like peptidoglycan-associated protein